MIRSRRPASYRREPTIVSCDDAREAISARFDGEKSDISDAILAGHVASCQTCQEFQSNLASLERQVRLRAWKPASEPLVPLLVSLLQSNTRPASTIAVRRRLRRRHNVGWLRVAEWAGAIAPAALAVLALLLGAWGGQPHPVADLAPNGCISYLLEHHVWPGYPGY